MKTEIKKYITIFSISALLLTVAIGNALAAQTTTTAAPKGIAGSVTAINGDTISVTAKNNTVYSVDATNAKMTEAGAATTISNIQVGDTLTVRGTISGTSVSATNIVDGTSQKQRQQNISTIITRSDKEITQRITALNNLVTRIGAMKNVSNTEKTSLTSQLQTQINDLTALKTKIDSDTDVTTLQADMKSITGDYRTYLLIIPQGQIIAASDRLNTIASDLSAVATKLSTRINAAQTGGNNMASLQSTLTDMQNKTSDAETQAQSAIDIVSSLIPDGGDQTKAQANTAALKQSRADIKTGTEDVQAANKDAETIMKGIKGLGLSSTTTTPAPAAAK